MFSERESFNGLELTLVETKPPSFGEKEVIALGPCVDMKIDGGSYQLKDTAIVTLPINAAIDNVPEVGYFDEALQEWHFLGIEHYDTLKKTITFKTTHFSIFMPIMVDIGGISKLLDEVVSNFRTSPLSLYMKSGKTDDFTIPELERIRDDAYERMEQMVDDYDACREISTCKIIFEDCLGTISELIVGEISEKVITDVVLKGVGGTAVVKVAYGIGDVITAAILMDCIGCFLPNSIVSCTFWRMYMTYYAADNLIHKIQNVQGILSYPATIRFTQTLKPGQDFSLSKNINSDLIFFDFIAAPHSKSGRGNASWLWTEMEVSFNGIPLDLYDAPHGPGMNQLGEWYKGAEYDFTEIIRNGFPELPASLIARALDVEKDGSVEFEIVFTLTRDPYPLQKIFARFKEIACGDLVHANFLKSSGVEVDFMDPQDEVMMFIAAHLDQLKREDAQIDYREKHKDIGRLLEWGTIHIELVNIIDDIHLSSVSMKEWIREINQNQVLVKKYTTMASDLIQSGWN